MAAPKLCRKCNGSQVCHTGPDGCWCRACLAFPNEADRCQSWEPAKAKPKPAVDRDVVAIGHAHPDTAQDMAVAALPKSGTLRAEVYGVIVETGGSTDDEIEQALDRSHQSVSGSRNTLAADKLIVDSGERRETRYGFQAIVWKVTALDSEPVDNVLQMRWNS